MEILEELFCPNCQASKPVDEFGVHRARANGRSRYCKVCNAAKERARQGSEGVRRTKRAEPGRPPPEQRALEAIRRCPPATLDEIAKRADLTTEIASNCVAILMLDARLIFSRVVSGVRRYYLSPTPGQKVRQVRPRRIPVTPGVSPIYFMGEK
jgi:hypothetical protein